MSLLALGSQIFDRYTVERMIGRGGMQEVYEAYDDTLRRRVALKVPQDARVARKFRESAVISAKVNHPSIAKTLDYFEESGSFYLIEELIEGLNLREVMQQFDRMDPHTSAYLLHNLARGLVASHRAGVVHRDLKPSNIMVVNGLSFNGLKITDFGIAKMAEAEVNDAVAGGTETTRSSKTVMNALAYLAPEVIDAPKTASKTADVWAVAAIAWEALTGAPPFGTGFQAMKAVFQNKRPILPSAVSDHVQFGGLAKTVHELIMKCLEPDPAKRLTAEQLSKECDLLCYQLPRRETGHIETYRTNQWGFIRSDSGSSVFFHIKNVIGAAPKGARVWFTAFPGSPSPRAIPVVPLKQEEQTN